MALQDMANELVGRVPGLDIDLAVTMIREAWHSIRKLRGWSFQIGQGGFSTPSQVNVGLATITFGSPVITGDAVATAAWLSASQFGSLITQRQFRVGGGTIYNIISQGTSQTVAYVNLLTFGLHQTPGIYFVNATGGGGSGAQIQVIVGANGVVSQTPIVTAVGMNYTSAPTFTLAAGGTPATFQATLNATLTLDRPYTDALSPTLGFGQGGFGSGGFGGVSAVNYLIYQPYYATPVKEFIRWLAVRDMTNVRWLDINGDYEKRRQIDMADPQRQIYTPPLVVVPFYTDQRVGSSTLGWFLYELYPQPLSQIVYQTWWEYLGPDIVNLTDTLPFPISETLVKSKALVDAYGWAEANKDPQNPRGSGADFRFVTEMYEERYHEELISCRVVDRERVNLFMGQMSRVGSPAPFSTWNPATGILSVSNLAQTS